MSKLGKQLIKGLKEVKEGRTELLYDGKWHCDGLEFNTFDEYSDYNRKKKTEKLKKMNPEKRKALKEKEKKEIAKRKAEDKKREEKWAKQRAKRGFSDDMVWAIDYTLLRLIPDMLEQLVKNMHGWQPQLGYKIEKGKLIKLKKVKMEHPYSKKMVMMYPEITFEDEQKVLKYLIKGFRQLYVYLDSEDMDYKKLKKLDKKEYHKFYIERQKKINELHKEIFGLFSDPQVFYSLWD